MSFGSRFIGCRIDSSERSFGRTSVSNELLTAVIYKHIREFGVATKTLGRGCFAHLRDSRAAVLPISSHVASAPSIPIAFCGYRRFIPAVVDEFIHQAFQNTKELRQ